MDLTGLSEAVMTDKVDSAIYIYDVEFNKIKTIKLKTFLGRVNHTLRNENQRATFAYSSLINLCLNHSLR